MKIISHTAILSFNVSQIYDLVDDIESYPKFLPWCRVVKIRNKTDTEVEASLTVAKGGFEKTFTTRNALVKNQSMKLGLVDGPFKKFEGLWKFEAIDEDHCRVTYTMEFEFKSFFVARLATPIFAKIADQMIDAFRKRAEELYQ